MVIGKKATFYSDSLAFFRTFCLVRCVLARLKIFVKNFLVCSVHRGVLYR